MSHTTAGVQTTSVDLSLRGVGVGSAWTITPTTPRVRRESAPAIASVGRQPHAIAPAGRRIPARKTPAWTPDCLRPVTAPRRPSGIWTDMSLLVPGLPDAWPIPVSPAAATNQTYDGAVDIARIPTPLNANIAATALRPPMASVNRPIAGEASAPIAENAATAQPSSARVSDKSSIMNLARTARAGPAKVAAAMAPASRVVNATRFGDLWPIGIGRPYPGRNTGFAAGIPRRGPTTDGRLTRITKQLAPEGAEDGTIPSVVGNASVPDKDFGQLKVRTSDGIRLSDHGDRAPNSDAPRHECNRGPKQGPGREAGRQ